MRIHKRPMVAALLASSALVAPAYAQTGAQTAEPAATQEPTEVGEIVPRSAKSS